MSEPMTPFEQRLAARLRDHVEAAGLDHSAEKVVGEVVSRPAAGRQRNPQFGRLASLLAGAAVVLLLVIGLPRLVPTPAGGPTPAPTVGGAVPPSDPEQLTWFERVDLSEDRLTVRLQFTGGPPYDAADHCSVEYSAWAEIVEQELHAAVWESRRPFRLLPVMCPAVGFRREVEVRLAQPFTGHLVRDLAGYVHFVSRPPDLAQIDVPTGWQLESERSGHSATGQWSQLYARIDPPPTSRRGHMTLYQTFNGPANVTGDERQPPMLVSGQPATLWRSESSGELVLEWRLGVHGLALVANRFDFSAAELIALAETARLPGSPTPQPTATFPATVTPAPSESLGPGASPAGAVRVLARPLVGPIEATVRGSAVWTGSEVILWGGWMAPPDYEPGHLTNVGGAYDPAQDSWRQINESPLAAREGHFATWTGTEMLIWGGGDSAGPIANGAAYDPAVDTWRLLPDAPPDWVNELRLTEDPTTSSVWTGADWVIAFEGSGDDQSDPVRLAAYNPAADAWRELPTVRVSRSGSIEIASTGTELLLTKFHALWRLRIGDASWQPVPATPWNLPLSSPVWIGDRLLALATRWDGGTVQWAFLATWDPSIVSWQALPQPSRSADGMLLWDGQRAVVLGSGLAYDLALEAWLDVPIPPIERQDATTIWAGRDLIIWGGWDCDMCPSGVFQEGLVLTPDW